MNREQSTSSTPAATAPQAVTAVAPEQPLTPMAPHFVPPRLTKRGTVAAVTQGGLGGSLSFP
ncbi:MAG: lasso RiPP family leader peptide-containing protein [Caldilineaceae bacterium]